MNQSNSSQEEISRGIGLCVLLWLRSDLPRELCYDYWREPHGQLMARIPGFINYRQHHFEDNPLFLWSDKIEIGTDCPSEQIPDGFAEVLIEGDKGEIPRQTNAVMNDYRTDERNVFERGLLYQTPVGGTNWPVNRAEIPNGSGLSSENRVMILFQQKSNADKMKFHKLINHQLPQILSSHSTITEIRSLLFDPLAEVSQSKEHEYQGAILIGGKEKSEVEHLLLSDSVIDCLNQNKDVLEALHGFYIARTYFMVEDSKLTMAAERGSTTAGIIHKMGAISQDTAW